jgi:hypothetical protein
MFTIEQYGQAGTVQKIVPGATATGISEEIYRYTERTMAFTSGGTTEIPIGAWILGATSAAVAEVIDVTLTGGTWAGGDAAGSLRLRCQVGTFQAAEKITYLAVADDATITANSVIAEGGYTGIRKGQEPLFAYIDVYGNTALINLNGSKPDQSRVIGIPAEVGSTIFLSDVNNIKNFKCIDYTNGSATQVVVTCFF